jgi:hypothetical protein
MSDSNVTPEHTCCRGVWLLAEQRPILSSFYALVMVLHTNANSMACARLDTLCLIFFLIKSKFTLIGQAKK